MPERRRSKKTLHEAVVIGHYVRFAKAKIRPFYNGQSKSDGSAMVIGHLNMAPKLLPGVMVSVKDGKDRVPVNVDKLQRILPEDVSEETIPPDENLDAYKEVGTEFPLLTKISVKRTQYTDNGYDFFTLAEE